MNIYLQALQGEAGLPAPAEEPLSYRGYAGPDPTLRATASFSHVTLVQEETQDQKAEIMTAPANHPPGTFCNGGKKILKQFSLVANET